MGQYQKFQFIAPWISSLLYGAYLVVFSTAVYLLTIAYFVNDFLAFEIAADSTVETASGVRVTDIANILACMGDAFNVASFLIADTILIWRYFLVCNRSFRSVLFPIAMLVSVCLCGFTIMGIDIKLYYLRLETPPSATGPPAIWLKLSDALTYLNIVYYATSVATNVYTSGLIAFRIWQVTREVRNIVGHSHGKKFMNASLMIVESGAIYSACLLLAIIVEPISSVPNLSRIVDVIVFYASGIVPTLLVVLIGLNKATVQTTYPTLHISDVEMGCEDGLQDKPLPKAGPIPLRVSRILGEISIPQTWLDDDCREVSSHGQSETVYSSCSRVAYRASAGTGAGRSGV
ncbi:hypothetical protein NEOLEDRAFT_833459 [Neolentinus lepideus HHB14362 ss-1]|uniref:Uncharacterized protein n=1 Tax=Neolentinus lepideus HHB14362 ss-1 TaxID=1314782 RepID=A0A165P7V6_9AGAM|nr:hypothetical protein NEOLEDRAFT_833459 [Neolentinus lepideus HHB14362 ss-1]